MGGTLFVMWTVVGAAALTLAAVHGLVWLLDRRGIANLRLAWSRSPWQGDPVMTLIFLSGSAMCAIEHTRAAGVGSLYMALLTRVNLRGLSWSSTVEAAAWGAT